MSRGGRRGGGRKGGPETEDWLDDLEDKKKWIPENTFPSIPHVKPAPLSQSERIRFLHYRRFREALRDGPLYTVLEPNSLTDEKGKVNKRAGFNPFEGMPTYSETKYKKAKRTLPDLSYRPYALKYYPQELWSILDPKRKAPEWQTLESQQTTSAVTLGKRVFADADKDDDDDEDDDDIRAAGRKKRRKKQRTDPTNPGQKKGLEAEDEYGPDPDQADPDEDGDEVENVDTDYSESDDGGGDDYDAEQYFDTGEADDYDDAGDGDDGGVF